MTAGSRPTIAELRRVTQPDTVVGRVSAEHWAGRLYMRRASVYVTRAVIPTPLTPDALTWLMLGCGVAAAVVLTVPTWWSALLAVVLVQLQGLLDCSDGELARWRQQTGPSGIYIDRLAHWVTDGGLVVAVGIHADGGLASMGGWTSLGLAGGFVVLLTKAETELVHVARALSGLPMNRDTQEVARPRHGWISRLRSLAATLPFNRILLAMELSGLALIASVVDAAAGYATAMQTLSVVLLVTALVVVVGHLVAILSSSRLR